MRNHFVANTRCAKCSKDLASFAKSSHSRFPLFYNRVWVRLGVAATTTRGRHVSQSAVVRRVWSNSASGYVRSAVRLILGVIAFRLICAEFSMEKLGFYGLVWSFLGYGVLLDFGMGVAIKKRTAELMQREDWNMLGRVLSSVLLCNCVCAVIFAAVGLAAADPLLRAIDVSPANQTDFRAALRVFVVGMAAMFPLEMFREVHYGQQRMAFADCASTVAGIISFALLVVALRMNWGLSLIICAQFTPLVVTGVVLVISALRAMPEVRLGIQYVSWDVLRGIARFSALAFLMVLAGIVVLQTDRVLVGAVLSVSAVATYHIGAKVPELFATFTRQLPDALAPATAALQGECHRAGLQRFFGQAIRLNALISTPLFLLCMLFIEGLLRLLTRGRAVGPDVVFLSRILLVWTYSTILTHGISKPVFLMSGHEGRLLRLLVIEALANVVMSFILLQWLESPVGAALGSLAPALLIGWCFLWPWAAREIGTTSVGLARQALVPAFRASGPLLAFGVSCRIVPTLDFRSDMTVFLVEAIAALAIAVAGTWYFGLAAGERTAVIAKVTRMVTGMRSFSWFGIGTYYSRIRQGKPE